MSIQQAAISNNLTAFETAYDRAVLDCNACRLIMRGGPLGNMGAQDNPSDNSFTWQYKYEPVIILRARAGIVRKARPSDGLSFFGGGDYNQTISLPVVTNTHFITLQTKLSMYSGGVRLSHQKRIDKRLEEGI